MNEDHKLPSDLAGRECRLMKVSTAGAIFVLAMACAAAAGPLPDAPQPRNTAENRRILHLVPAYDVARADAAYHSLRVREKLNLFANDTFDRWTIVKAAADAGIGQAADRPHYGQGGEAYGKRFGAALADGASYNFFTEFAFPAVLRQDPRYFRLGSGSIDGHRLAYALSRVMITRNDSGRNGPNLSLILGGVAATTLSNPYYPERDQTAGYTLVRFGEQMAVVAATNVLKEFWPGIRSKLPKMLQ
jgi:hypothetical protein